MCEIFTEVGIPAGVVNVVFGTGPKVGQALVSHPDVTCVSFTGGTSTGLRIAQSAAGKKISLEVSSHFDTTPFDPKGKYQNESIKTKVSKLFLFFLISSLAERIRRSFSKISTEL